MNSRLVFVFLLLITFYYSAFALVAGSLNSVSVESLVTFPSVDTDNAMVGFGWFKNGFKLEVATIHRGSGLHQISCDSFFEIDDINGITIGNSESADFTCDILSGSVLQVSQGTLSYKNSRIASWNMISDRSWLQIMNGAFLRLYKNIDLGLGILQTRGDVVLSRRFGKELKGTVVTLGRLIKEYIA